MGHDTRKRFLLLTEDARTRTKAGGTAPCLLLRTVKTETHFFEHAAAASSVALSAFAASRAPCPPHAPAAHRRRSRRSPRACFAQMLMPVSTSRRRDARPRAGDINGGGTASSVVSDPGPRPGLCRSVGPQGSLYTCAYTRRARPSHMKDFAGLSSD